jgi:hypothetical protein
MVVVVNVDATAERFVGFVVDDAIPPDGVEASVDDEAGELRPSTPPEPLRGLSMERCNIRHCFQ